MIRIMFSVSQKTITGQNKLYITTDCVCAGCVDIISVGYVLNSRYANRLLANCNKCLGDNIVYLLIDFVFCSPCHAQ